MVKKLMDVSEHILIPKHSKISEKEKTELMQKYDITFNKLPKILITDPAIRSLDPKVGDVIKIIRPSSTAEKTTFYRGVIND